MKRSLLKVTTAMLVVFTANYSIASSTESTAVLADKQASATMPDTESIKSDLIGRSMYVTQGKTGLWQFSSLSDILQTTMSSAHKDGDVLEFDFKMILSDSYSSNQELYRAEITVTYEKGSQGWKLQSVEGNSVEKVELAFINQTNLLTDKC